MLSEQALAQHIGHVLVGRPAVPCKGIIQGALGVEVAGHHLEHQLVGGMALLAADAFGTSTGGAMGVGTLLGGSGGLGLCPISLYDCGGLCFLRGLGGLRRPACLCRGPLQQAGKAAHIGIAPDVCRPYAAPAGIISVHFLDAEIFWIHILSFRILLSFRDGSGIFLQQYGHLELVLLHPDVHAPLVLLSLPLHIGQADAVEGHEGRPGGVRPGGRLLSRDRESGLAVEADLPVERVAYLQQIEPVLPFPGEGDIPLPGLHPFTGLQGVAQQVVQDDAHVVGIESSGGGKGEIRLEADAQPGRGPPDIAQDYVRDGIPCGHAGLQGLYALLHLGHVALHVPVAVPLRQAPDVGQMAPQIVFHPAQPVVELLHLGQPLLNACQLLLFHEMPAPLLLEGHVLLAEGNRGQSPRVEQGGQQGHDAHGHRHLLVELENGIPVCHDEELQGDADEEDSRHRRQQQVAQLPDMQGKGPSPQHQNQAPEHEGKEEERQRFDADVVQRRAQEDLLRGICARQEEPIGKMVQALCGHQAQMPGAEEQHSQQEQGFPPDAQKPPANRQKRRQKQHAQPAAEGEHIAQREDDNIVNQHEQAFSARAPPASRALVQEGAQESRHAGPIEDHLYPCGYPVEQYEI